MSKPKAIFNAWLFNPVFWHILEALQNPKIRKILVRGGSSASKTYSFCDALSINQLGDSTGNVFALRKHRIHVETTIKQSFEESIKRLIDIRDRFTLMDGEIRTSSGARTLYAGMDDEEKVKGLASFKFIYVNELNQFLATEWEELQRRLRGRPDQKLLADWNPIQKTHWINDEILSEEEGWIDLPLTLPHYEELYGAITQLTPGYSFKRINAAGDTLWINVTYRDNFWVVGHPANNVPAVTGRVAYRDADPTKPITLEPGMFVASDGNLYGFVDIHSLANFERMKVKKPNDYRIYGMGQDGLMRTGGEAWRQYDEVKHVRDLGGLQMDEVLHLSLDKNVVPYITVGGWQVIPIWEEDEKRELTEIRQVLEVPCIPPDNTAFRAALATGKYLDRIGFKGLLFVWGDPSALARSTEDDEGRSFFDKFIGTMEKLGFRVINKVQKSPPAVALSIDFIDDIYAENVDPYRIVIDSACKVSREDYSLVKQDPKTGKLLKELVPDPLDPDKKRKYQKYGHFSDAKRYFIVGILFDVWLKYKNRSRTPRVLSVPESP
jgi:phage terminase large subunit